MLMEYFLYGVAEADQIIEELKLLEEERDRLAVERENLAIQVTEAAYGKEKDLLATDLIQLKENERRHEFII